MKRGYKHLGVALFGLLALSASQPVEGQTALPWSDDFESYSDSTSLDAVNGWQGWGNNSSVAATTTTSPPAPLPNSAAVIQTADDALVRFTPPGTGEWVVAFRQYIPSSHAGTTYFIMLNQYDDSCTTCNWSVQVQFNGTTGLMVDDGTASSQAYLTDQWVDIRIEIDLDSDTQRFLYNGVQFYTGTWSGHISGGGATEIGSINLFANGATAVYYDDFSVTEVISAPLPWSDDFESYTDATLLDGFNGWQGWQGNSSFAATTTTSPPAPIPNSAVEIEGNDDALVRFIPPATGRWAVEFRQYIPSSLSGTSFFVMLNQYDDVCSTCNWSTQVQFNSATGMMTDDGGATSQPYLTDQWVDVRIEIDLGADTQRFLYNGVQFYMGTWSGHVSGGGATEIAAINLYANAASSVYYDDLSVTVIPSPSLPWSDDFESYADATVLQGLNGWQGWFNNPSFAATTTTSPPAPLPNSALAVENTDDVLARFSPPTAGLWLLQFKQYIPSDLAGTSYFIMLNQYDDTCSSCNWSVQVPFDGATGFMTDDGTAATQAYIADQWIDIAIEIDLDSDSHAFSYNGVLFYTGTWSGHISGGGTTEIGAISLFANGASSVYYDDFSLSEIGLPVELTSFVAKADGESVVLLWSTASETNNAGFVVEQALDGATFRNIGYVEGGGTTEEPQDYYFEVNHLAPGAHRFRLKQIDFDGTFHYSPVAEVILTVPDHLWIERPHPNPFNVSSKLRFGVPVDQVVSVSMIDVMGRVVRILHDGLVFANRRQSVTIDAGGLSSGVYFVRFEGREHSAVERIVLAN